MICRSIFIFQYYQLIDIFRFYLNLYRLVPVFSSRGRFLWWFLGDHEFAEEQCECPRTGKHACAPFSGHGQINLPRTKSETNESRLDSRKGSFSTKETPGSPRIGVAWRHRPSVVEVPFAPCLPDLGGSVLCCFAVEGVLVFVPQFHGHLMVFEFCKHLIYLLFLVWNWVKLFLFIF